ncbi:MAG: hypothetical protein JZU53_15425 [Paludibacter sp.]|nr:hypothetical protein [Paludibacter sp.]
MKQNPFSIYDILGYLTPGLFLISNFFLIQTWKITCDQSTISSLLGSIPSFKFEVFVVIFIFAYSLGHLLSFASSITVEKYSIWKYGYTSKYLLKISRPRFRDHFKTFYGFFWGSMIMIIILPTVILDVILGNFSGFKIFYSQALDDNLIQLIKFKINKLANTLGITAKNKFVMGNGHEGDFFRLVFHYTYENSKNHQDKFINYVALYGFLRTMTLIANILTWYLVVHFILIRQLNLQSILMIIISSIISYIFFMAFMKFYRRYTLEALMVLASDKDLI